MKNIKDSIGKECDEKYHKVLEKRIDALFHYLSDDLGNCIDLLKEALASAKSENAPRWIIDDILIDLRNVVIWHNNSINSYAVEDEFQKELEEGCYVLNYPVMDRIHTNLYENLVTFQIV